MNYTTIKELKDELTALAGHCERIKLVIDRLNGKDVLLPSTTTVGLPVTAGSLPIELKDEDLIEILEKTLRENETKLRKVISNLELQTRTSDTVI